MNKENPADKSQKKANKKKKNQFITYARVLLMLLIGGMAGYFIAQFFKGDSSSASSASTVPILYKVALIPMFLGVIFIVLAIHEVGHTLAGIWVGFEFRMITVGPFMLQKENGRIRFRWNTRLNAAGGLALCLPKTDHRLRSNFIKFVAGGPLASLFFALLSGIIYFGVYHHSTAFLGRVFWQMSGLMSIAIFFTTIIPMRAGGFFTDGARMLNLLKGGTNAEVDMAILTLTSASTAGVRPRELNMAPVHKILEAGYQHQHPFVPYLHLYQSAYLHDTGNQPQAYDSLQKAFEYLDEIPSGYQAVLWLDLAFHEAYYRQDLEAAQAAFAEAKISAVIPKHTVLKSEAVILWLKQQYPQAKEKTEAALQALPQAMDAGGAIAEKEWLEKFLEELEVSTTK